MLCDGLIIVVDTSYLPGPGAASFEAKGSLLEVESMIFFGLRGCFTRLRDTLY